MSCIDRNNNFFKLNNNVITIFLILRINVLMSTCAEVLSDVLLFAYNINICIASNKLKSTNLQNITDWKAVRVLQTIPNVVLQSLLKICYNICLF